METVAYDMFRLFVQRKEKEGCLSLFLLCTGAHKEIFQLTPDAPRAAGRNQKPASCPIMYRGA